MEIYKKVTAGLALLLIIFSFSGCSIRRADSISSENGKSEEISTDTDGDGLMDDEEKKRGTRIDEKDTDGDGLTDFEEVRTWGCDPNKKDTDGDGYDDGEEVKAGYDPNSLGQLDTDRDGLYNPQEIKLGTDPNKADTDGDGVSDKEEIDYGTDPLSSDR